jgi:cell division protein FtsL
MKNIFLFSIIILIKLILNKDFSVFDVKNKENNTKNSTIDKKLTNDSLKIEQLKIRAKRIACLSLIRNSINNKTSELKLFLQEHKKAYFSYFKKITDYCKDKISEEQAEYILTNKNVTNSSDSNPIFKELIFNDYIKNLNLDDDFVDKKEEKKEKKKVEKKEKKKKNNKKNNKKKKKIEKIIKISIIAISCMFLLLLIFLFIMYRTKPKILSKSNIENLNQSKKKNKKNKTE